MRLLVYSLLRVLLILAAAGVLHLLGMRSWLLWVTAVVVGAMLSFLLLKPQGREAAGVLAELDPMRDQRPTFSKDVEADAAYEDALVDAATGGAAAVAGSSAREERTAESSGTLEREPGVGSSGTLDREPGVGSSATLDREPGVSPAGTLEREPGAEEDAVPELEQARVAQDDDEVAARGAAEDRPREAHGPRHEQEDQQGPR